MSSLIIFMLVLVALCVVSLSLPKLGSFLERKGIKKSLKDFFIKTKEFTFDVVIVIIITMIISFIFEIFINSFKFIFFPKKYVVFGKAINVRSPQKNIVIDGEPNSVSIKYRLTFTNENGKIDYASIDQYNFNLIKAINPKGKDVIVFFKKHFLFGRWTEEIRIRTHDDSRFLDLKIY